MEAEVEDGGEAVLVQWLRDSAFRFAMLAFEGEPPDAAVLAGRWRVLLAEARRIVGALSGGRIAFHPGSIRGAFPGVRPRP